LKGTEHIRTRLEPRDVKDAILRIYIATHCSGCRESRRLARVAAARLSQIRVELINIDDQAPLDEIFAVPTFVYRDRRVALGNPREEDLIGRIVEIERVATGVTLSPARRESRYPLPKIRNNLLACGGATGILGTVLCSLSMIVATAGVFTSGGLLPMRHLSTPVVSGTTMGVSKEAGSLPGWLATLVQLGPEIMGISVALLLASILLRHRPGVFTALVGGAILYAGMFLQSSPGLMYGSMILGTGLLVVAYMGALPRLQVVGRVLHG
jgi:hypothetical protein